MKQFQIRLNNVAISINDLDEIAAEVFNVPFSEHEYAKPVTTWEEVGYVPVTL